MPALLGENYDLAFISEAWLKSKNEVPPLLGPTTSCYQAGRCNRWNKRGGSMVMFTKILLLVMKFFLNSMTTHISTYCWRHYCRSGRYVLFHLQSLYNLPVYSTFKLIRDFPFTDLPLVVLAISTLLISSGALLTPHKPPNYRHNLRTCFSLTNFHSWFLVLLERASFST